MNDYPAAWVGHLLSASAIFGAVLGWFPGIAAFVAFVFYCIQIYESNVFKHWRVHRRETRIARLEAKVKHLNSIKEE